MTNPSVHPPLSNFQAELLKLFSAEIPENHLLELKTVMAKFLLDKARDKPDAICAQYPNILSTIPFPSINVIPLEKFAELLAS